MNGRRVRRWLVGVPALLLLAALGVLAPSAARAQTPSGAQVTLVGQTPFVAPTDTLRVDLGVAGAPEGAELTFTLRSSVTRPLGGGTAQARFDAWVAGTPPAEDPFNSPKTIPVANLPAGDGPDKVSASFQIVPTEAELPLVGFQISDPGVYPLTVTLAGPEGGPALDSFTTYVVRLPTRAETAPPLQVAPLADLRAPIALEPDGTRSIEPGALDRIRTLVAALVDHPSVPLTIDPSPETLESLEAAGPLPSTGSAPATTGAQLIDRLRSASAGRSALGATYVGLDVAAWVRSGMDDPLAYQLSRGVDIARSFLHDDPPIDQRTWSAGPGLTPEALTTLHGLGIDQVVLPAEVVGPIDGVTDATRVQAAATQPFDVQGADGERVRAVTSRASFGQRLTTTDDPVLNAQILVADLAVTYFGALNPQPLDVPDSPRGVTFQVPDDERALEALGPFLAALATVPPADGGGAAILAPVTLAQLFALPPTTTGPDGFAALRTFSPAPVAGEPQDMGDYPDELEKADFALSAYESMVIDTEPDRVLPLRQLLDVSGAAELTADERQQYLDASTATVDAQIAGVRIPEQDQINLTATDQDITVVVENDLPYPVSVRIALASSKLTFPDGDTLDVQLAPGRNRLPVTVNTVSGGTFPVEIRVATPDSRVQLGDATLEVRSTAVSGLGLALTIFAGFFLAVWWARNWRNTRRTNVAAATAEGAGGAEVAGTEPAAAGPRVPSGFTVGPLDRLAEGTEPDPPAAVEPADGAVDGPADAPTGRPVV